MWERLPRVLFVFQTLGLEAISIWPIDSFAPFASKNRALPTGAPRKNHTWVMCHLVEPSRDVGPGGRHESVAGAPHRCGFNGAQPLSWQRIHVSRGMTCPGCLVCHCASF